KAAIKAGVNRMFALDPRHCRKNRKRVADRLTIAVGSKRCELAYVEIGKLIHRGWSHRLRLCAGPAKIGWIISGPVIAVVGPNGHVGFEVKQQAGSKGVRLIEREGVAALAVRQLAFLFRSGKTIVTTHLDPFPISVVETEIVARRQLIVDFAKN